MTKPSIEERIVRRIKDAETALAPFRRKVHRLRGVVAGDRDAADFGTRGKATEDWKLSRPFAPEFGDFFVEDLGDVRSSDMCQALRTLIFQTNFTSPDIEVDEVSPVESLVMSQYLGERLGPSPLGCNAVQHAVLALAEYAIGGIGGLHTCVRREQPVAQAFDTLDFSFDPHVRVIEDMTWGALEVRKPWWYWKEYFHEVRLRKFESLKNVSDDSPQAVVFYFDTEEPEKGRYIAFLRKAQRELFDSPIVKDANPNYTDVRSRRVPYLPFVIASFLQLPNVRMPEGLARDMLAPQRAIWEAEMTQDTKIRRMRDFYQMEKGTLSEEQKGRFEGGEIGALVERNKGFPPITIESGSQLTGEEADYSARHERKLVAMAGVNPYASGAPVEGTEFATESVAIQRFASLMAGVIGRDNSLMWRELCRQVLALGRLYDKAPLVCKLPREDGESDPMVFDASDPISEYLDPSVKIVVREDSMSFVPREQKIAQAAGMIEIGLKVAGAFPGFLAQAVEKYLRASGEKNLGKWMQRPSAPAVAGGSPTVGGEGPSAQSVPAGVAG